MSEKKRVRFSEQHEVRLFENDSEDEFADDEDFEPTAKRPALQRNEGECIMLAGQGHVCLPIRVPSLHTLAV